MVMTFKIMDDSENEATFNMFMRESVHFPVITAAGDVIFLRRVLVSPQDSNFYVFCLLKTRPFFFFFFCLNFVFHCFWLLPCLYFVKFYFYKSIMCSASIVYVFIGEMNLFQVKLYNNEPVLEFSHHKSGYGLYGGANVGTFEPYLPRQACVAPTNVNVEVDRLREWRRDASLDTGLFSQHYVSFGSSFFIYLNPKPHFVFGDSYL